MAAPQQAPEQAFRLRKFQGTNTDIDSTFLGPSLVNASENWIPAQSYRLGKRPGTLLLTRLGNGVLSITDILVVTISPTEHVLYAYCRRAGDARVFALVNETGAVTSVATFASPTAWGRLVRFRDRVYALNGVDPMQSWKSTVPATELQVYGDIADLGDIPGAMTPTVAPTAGNVVAAGGTALPDGTYAFTWARYDKVSRLYTARYKAGSVIVPPQSTASFPLPAAPPANEVWRLFVAYRGFPIEYATMQADHPHGQVPAITAVTLATVDVTDDRCPMIGIVRKGNMAVVWRNRVVFSGDPANPFDVCATDTILPGLEQDSFNHGTFFPVNAKLRLPAPCTGVGIAGVTTDQDAHAPLLFFTSTRTFLCMGDPFSTTVPAEIIEVSSRIGCIGHDSIVNTPFGTIFVGMDSIYLIPPGGGYPEDIGWPISDHIRHMPPALRSTIVGQFHKQFYKLAIPPRGASTNEEQWWLDLRMGVSSTPSWWGPHLGTSVVAATVDLDSLTEPDRGYAVHSGDVIVLTHQTSRFADYSPSRDALIGIRSVLRSGRFDADEPFVAKIFTRLRLIAQTNAHSFINVSMKTDDGVPWIIDPIELGLNMLSPGQFVPEALAPLPPPIPDKNAFNHGKKPPAPPSDEFPITRGKAQFGSIAPVEVQTITPAIRPRGLSIVVTLTHQPMLGNEDFAARVELRDFELLFIPSERKVRYVGESTGR